MQSTQFIQPTFTNDLNDTRKRELYFKHRVETQLSQSVVKSNMDQEFQGIDFTIKGKTFDLKWTNTIRPTYAVEVLYNNAFNMKKLGWFMDIQHQTDICFFVEASKKVNQINAFSVSLQELRQYMKQRTSSKLVLQLANEMREHNIQREWLPGTNLKFVYSNYLRERPVNLVIPKSEYKTLSSYHEHNNWFGTMADYSQFLSTLMAG